MSEGQVVNACIKWLLYNKCFVWRQNTGAWKPEGSKRPIYYGKKGSGDIIGMTPTGRFIAIECKWGDNDLSPYQKDFGQKVRESGGIYLIARNSAQALEDHKQLILS